MALRLQLLRSICWFWLATGSAIYVPSSIATEEGLLLEEVRNGVVKQSVAQSRRARIADIARALVVPSGRVAPEYGRYQLLHVCQDVSTQLRGTLGTSAILSGLGLGGGASMGAAAATLVFLSRDAAGMGASLTAAAALAPKLGGDARRFRFAADVAIDLALLLELLSSKRWFLPLLCVSAALKAVCGVLAGGANAAIGAYFARSAGGGDVAEVTAKTSAVSTLSGIVGLALSMSATVVCSALVPTKWRFALSLAAYATLTAIHLATCAAGLRCLALDTIGCPRRFAIAHERWISTGIAPSPALLAHLDRVVGIPALSPSLDSVKVGANRLRRARMKDVFDAYVLTATSDGVTALAMLDGATPADERRALTHALMIAHVAKRTPGFDADALRKLRPSDLESEIFDARLKAAGFNLDARIFAADVPVFRITQRKPDIGRSSSSGNSSTVDSVHNDSPAASRSTTLPCDVPEIPTSSQSPVVLEKLATEPRLDDLNQFPPQKLPP